MSKAELINNVIATVASSAGAYMGARSNKKRLKKFLEEELAKHIYPRLEQLASAVKSLLPGGVR